MSVEPISTVCRYFPEIPTASQVMVKCVKTRLYRKIALSIPCLGGRVDGFLCKWDKKEENAFSRLFARLGANWTKKNISVTNVEIFSVL